MGIYWLSQWLSKETLSFWSWIPFQRNSWLSNMSLTTYSTPLPFTSIYLEKQYYLHHLKPIYPCPHHPFTILDICPYFLIKCFTISAYIKSSFFWKFYYFISSQNTPDPHISSFCLHHMCKPLVPTYKSKCLLTKIWTICWWHNLGIRAHGRIESRVEKIHDAYIVSFMIPFLIILFPLSQYWGFCTYSSHSAIIKRGCPSLCFN